MSDFKIQLLKVSHLVRACVRAIGLKCKEFRIGQTLQKVVFRPADLAARYGGEEFVVLLANTDLEGGIKVAENIQQEIHALAIPHAQSDVKEIVTVSLGISSLIPTLEVQRDTLVADADKALYDAKQHGRDRFAIYRGS